MTSATECLPAKMRPLALIVARMHIIRSRAMRSVRFLMYLGRAKIVIKKMVVTTMTCVEGKEGSPEPSGRVLKTQILSKRK